MLPDKLTFTPDGRRLLVANEATPIDCERPFSEKREAIQYEIGCLETQSKGQYLRPPTTTAMNSGRKPDLEDRDAALRMDTNIAAMGMGNGTGNGQPQTCSFAKTLPRRINPIEAVK